MNNSPNDNTGPPAKGCGERTRPPMLAAALVLAMTVLLSLHPACPALADSPPGAAPVADVQISERPAKERPGADEDRERVVTIGVSLVMIVALCGAILLLGVVVGGRYVRRIARKPLPSSAVRDELWYLKTRSEFAARESPRARGEMSPPPATYDDSPPDSSREGSD